MKAVRLVKVGMPLEDAQIALPKIGPSEVLVRVAACGVCHSDAHYRAGISPINSLPVTLGHEVAGRVEAVGKNVDHVASGDRVCVHYLQSCGSCDFCSRGNEQFCSTGQMIGKHRDGGYAEFINVPARNVFVLPDDISFEQGAIMMCSSATALHALNKARLKSDESIAIFGFGGLGFSALQLARAFRLRRSVCRRGQPCQTHLERGTGSRPDRTQLWMPLRSLPTTHPRSISGLTSDVRPLSLNNRLDPAGEAGLYCRTVGRCLRLM